MGSFSIWWRTIRISTIRVMARTDTHTHQQLKLPHHALSVSIFKDAMMDDGFEEFDEDGLVDSDDDDNSWKVRRAALKARSAWLLFSA